MRLHYLILAFVVLLTSCSNTEERIPKEEFIDLLIDLHVFDAISMDFNIKSQLSELDSLTLHASILEKHNTTKENFENTMKWYTENPDLLAEVYNEVFGTIDKRNEQLNENIGLFNISKSKEIWSDKQFLRILGDTVKYPEPYVIETEGLGTYLFDLKIRMLPQDQSLDPYVKLYFHKGISDTISEERLLIAYVPILKTNYTRDYQYIHDLQDDSYKYMKIILPDTPDRESGKNKNLQISRIRIFKKKEVATDTVPSIKEQPE